MDLKLNNTVPVTVVTQYAYLEPSPPDGQEGGGEVTVFHESGETKLAKKDFVKEYGKGSTMEYVGVLTGSRDCVLNANDNTTASHITLTTVPQYSNQKPREVYSATNYHHLCLYTGSAISRVHTESVETYNGTAKGAIGCEKTVCNARAGVTFRVTKTDENKELSELRDTRLFSLPNPASLNVFNSFNSSRINLAIHLEMDLLFVLKMMISINCRYRQDNLDLVHTNFLWLFFDKSRDNYHSQSNMCVDAPYAFAHEIASIFKTANSPKVVENANAVLSTPPNQNGTKCHHHKTLPQENPEKYLWKLPDCFDPKSQNQDRCCVYCYLRLLYVENTPRMPNVLKITTHRKKLDRMMRAINSPQKNLRELSAVNEAIQNLCAIQIDHMQQNPICLRSPAVVPDVDVFNFTNYSLMEIFRLYSHNHLDNQPAKTLYHLMNNFGKMTLLTLIRNNNDIVGSIIKGKFLDIDYVGPNPNNVLVYGYHSLDSQINGNDHFNFDSLRRIPSKLHPNGVGAAIQLDTLVRDSVLRKSAQTIHVVDQLTKEIKLFKEKFDNIFFDMNAHSDLCHIPKSYKLRAPSNMCLEVANFEQFQDQVGVNGNAIGNRILRRGSVRDGSKVFLLNNKILVFESLTNESKIQEADTRYLEQVRVGVYDIETTSIDADDAVAGITSIGLAVTGGKNMEIIKSFIFVLGDESLQQDTEAELTRYDKSQTDLFTEKEAKGEKLCPSFSYMKKSCGPKNTTVVSCLTERDLIVNFSSFMNRDIDVDFLSGYNIKSFDHPYLFYRACKITYELIGELDHCKICVEQLRRLNTQSTKKQLRVVMAALAEATDRIELLERQVNQMVGRKGFFGLFNLEWLFKSDAKQQNAVWGILKKEYRAHMNAGWDPTHKRLTTYQKLMSASVLTSYFDIYDTVLKNYSGHLSLKLNDILKTVCGVDANQKLQIKADVLLRYPKLRQEKQAQIHVYCLKDCWLTAYLQKHLGIVLNGLQFSSWSGYSMSSVFAAVHTQSKLVSGILNKATPTKLLHSKPVNRKPFNNHRLNIEGGLVAEPLVSQCAATTVDFSSLYPSNMANNNFCQSTSVYHGQITQSLGELIAHHRAAAPASSPPQEEEEEEEEEAFSEEKLKELAIFDAALRDIHELYNPHDICCQLWMKGDPETVEMVFREQREKVSCNTTSEADDVVDDAATTDEKKIKRSDASIVEDEDDNNDEEAEDVEDGDGLSKPQQQQQQQQQQQRQRTKKAKKEHSKKQVGVGDDDEHDYMFDQDLNCDIILGEDGGEYYSDFVVSADAPPENIEGLNMNTIHRATDMCCYPSESCCPTSQFIAARAEDSHVQPGSLEYMVPFIPVFCIKKPSLVSTLTNGALKSLEELFLHLERDFGLETVPSPQERLERLNQTLRERTYSPDSITDPAVVKWARRLLDVGSYYRAWFCKASVRLGIIPELEIRLKKVRGVHKKMAKEATNEYDRDLQDKTQNFIKLIMNLFYGIAAALNCSVTCHYVIGSVITFSGRRAFLNILPTLRRFLPLLVTVYGDTDSAFIENNWDVIAHKLMTENGAKCIEVDFQAERNIASFYADIVNKKTKGVFFEKSVTGGKAMMNIEQERHALHVNLDKKKCYFMLHWLIGSKDMKKLESKLTEINNAATSEEAETLCQAFNDSNTNTWGGAIRISKTTMFSSDVRPTFHHTEEFVKEFGEDSVNKLKASFYTIKVELLAMTTAYYNMFMKSPSTKWVSVDKNQPLDQQLLRKASSLKGLLAVYLKGLYVKDSLSIMSKQIKLQEFFRTLSDGQIDYLDHLADNIKGFLNGKGVGDTFTVGAVKTINSNKSPGPNHLAVAIHNDLLPAERAIRTCEKTFFANFTQTQRFVSNLLVKAGGNTLGGWYNITKQQRKTWNGEEMRGVLTCYSANILGCIPNLPACLCTNFKQLVTDAEKTFTNKLHRIVDIVLGDKLVVNRHQLCFAYGFNVEREHRRFANTNNASFRQLRSQSEWDAMVRRAKIKTAERLLPKGTDFISQHRAHQQLKNLSAEKLAVKLTPLDNKILEITKVLYMTNQINEDRTVEVLARQYESVKSKGKGAVSERLEMALEDVNNVHNRVKKDIVHVLKRLELFVTLHMILNHDSVILNCRDQQCNQVHKRETGATKRIAAEPARKKRKLAISSSSSSDIPTPLSAPTRLNCSELKANFYKAIAMKEYEGSIKKLVNTLVNFSPNILDMVDFCATRVIEHADACTLSLDRASIVKMMVDPYSCTGVCKEALVIVFTASYLYEVFVATILHRHDINTFGKLVMKCGGLSVLKEFHASQFGHTSENFFQTHTKDGRVNQLQPFLQRLCQKVAQQQQLPIWTSRKTYDFLKRVTVNPQEKVRDSTYNVQMLSLPKHIERHEIVGEFNRSVSLVPGITNTEELALVACVVCHRVEEFVTLHRRC